jgi:peptide/nickel transport system substrate-binding protein
MNFLNVRKPPTNELAVRQAINFALNKEAMVKAYYEGLATPAWNVLSSNTFGYDRRIDTLFYKYDPERAKQLLEGAGWKMGPDGVRAKEGQRLHLEMFRSYPNEKEDYKELMAAQLAAVGFSTKLFPGGGPQRANAGSQGLHHAINRQFEASDPHFLVDLFHTRGIGTYAWSMVSDPKLDKMLEEQDMAIDPEKRKASLWDIAREIMEKAYVVPIYESIFVWVARPDVQDLDLDARVWYPYFQDVWFKR